MPLLDVSDIVSDPDLVTLGLICKHNAIAINDSGVGSQAQTQEIFAGVVTNDDGDVLHRESQGEHVEASITVHARLPLSAGGPGTTADIVTWSGRDYVVRSVQDYSKWGRGFTAAQCVLMALSG